MNKKVIDLWVGIFVAIGLAALLFLALKVGNLLTFGQDRKGYELEASFENIGALKRFGWTKKRMRQSPVCTYFLSINLVATRLLRSTHQDCSAISSSVLSRAVTP